jgi:arylsulfatase A-like enzyme
MRSKNALSRRAWMRAAGLGALTLGERTLEATNNQSVPPNVILVLVDDVGYGDFACLGNPYIKTPNVDKLHSRSVRFTDFHVSPTCAPTRSSLMTGRYCDAVGVWHTIMGRSLLDPRQVTLANCFKDSGYATGIYGKWHLGDNYPCRPHDRGFDDAVVCGGGGIWQTPDYFGNDDTNDAYLHNGRFQKYSGFSTDCFFDLAMNFIGGAHKQNQPFFCYLATTAAHEPTWAPEKDSAVYRDVPGLKTPGFYGMIGNIDNNLGRLTQFLEDRGLTDNTILIFASDNGTADGANVYNASMRGMKGSPYDGGHRVPLFLYWPGGGLKGGRDINTLTAHIDVLPTLVDLCKLRNHGARVDGKSWRPLLYETHPKRDQRTIFVDSQREERLRKWKDTAVMTERWRLVSSSSKSNTGQLELYDIGKDPGQKTDVAAKYPQIVKSLTTQYDAWWSRVSADDSAYVRIVLGAEQENPSFLTCMDWHGDANDVWNQRQIRQAPVANGFWAVDVLNAGRYRFELRRWPREVDLPMDAPYVDIKPNREKTPGIGVGVVRGHLSIGGIAQEAEVKPGDKYVDFIVSLPKGPAELRTVLVDTDRVTRGAYYVYVERH